MSQSTADSSNKSQHEEDFASVNSKLCAVCDAVFSKRRLTLRYQCGICAKSVCSACSPSRVQLEGHVGMQRVCTPCIANAAKVPAAQSRLLRLGEQFDALGSKCTGPSLPPVECKNLEEALDFSESAVVPLEDIQDRFATEKAQTEKLEKALQTEKHVRAKLEQELRGKKHTIQKISMEDSAHLVHCAPEKKAVDESVRKKLIKALMLLECGEQTNTNQKGEQNRSEWNRNGDGEKQEQEKGRGSSSSGKQQQSRGLNCINACTQQ